MVGKIFYSIQLGHKVIGNSIVSNPISLYLHFINEEKSAEKRPHLLVGLSPILGFPGYILCSFVWMVCIFSYSIIFINLSNRLLVTILRSKEN
jgi:hypothetical protein